MRAYPTSPLEKNQPESRIVHRHRRCFHCATAGTAMATKLSEGDTVGMTGDVTLIHDDGTVTLRLHGYDYPLTVRAEHLSLIAKSSAPKRKRPLFDEH